MKKILTSIISLLVSASIFAAHVSPEEAALVANNFMNGVPTSENGVNKVSPAKRMVLKSAAETASPYYIYQNENGEGWVIIAANDAVTPILAFSETGYFRTDNMPSNLRKWMGKYDSFIRKIEADGITSSEEAQAEWRALRSGARKATAATVVVDPLIQTQWDQDAPYNDLCPGTKNYDKAYTGCVATSMAQVMKYWEWPKQGSGSHTYQPIMTDYDENDSIIVDTIYPGQLTVNFENTTYDWANMKKKHTSYDTQTQKTAISTLMYHCGVATEMMYGDDNYNGSGTYSVNYNDWEWGVNNSDEGGCAQNALWAYFKYNKDSITSYMRDGYEVDGWTFYEPWTDEDWTAMIKKELDKHRPILYAGASEKGGHSFICDGYRSDNYFHFNWGWSGSNDGYFLLSNLNPGSGGAGGGGYNFSEDQDVIIGIVPDRQDLPEVVVTWSVDGDTSSTVFKQGDPLVLPTTPADCTCGKQFVGWTADSTLTDGAKPADLFKTAAGKNVEENITYYAVFAEQDGEGGGGGEPTEVASVSFLSGSSDSSQDGSSDIATKLVDSATGISSYSGTKLYKGKNGMKMGTGSATGSITLTLSNTVTVSKVVINGTQYGSDTGKLKVTAGTTELGSQSPASDMEFNANPAVETNTITVETTSKRAYVSTISVVAGSGASYTNYSIHCECGGSAIEHTEMTPRVEKTIENGQIIILRGKERYSIFGQKIQ